MKGKLRYCPDCSAKPGQQHMDGCDIEHCSVCGSQRLGCDCDGHDKNFAKWTGIWPGKAESQFLDIDLNTFYMLGYPGIFFVKEGEKAPKQIVKGRKK